MITPARVVVCFVGAVIVAALVGIGLGWWSSGASGRALTRPLAVRTLLLPTAGFFGDPIDAEVVVDVDDQVVRTGSVRVEPSFAPFVESAPPAIERTATGRDVTLTFTYTIQCVSDGCLPVGADRTTRLPSVVVAASAGARHLTVTVGWPVLSVSSRLSASDVHRASPAFHRPSTLPSPAYGIPPGGTALTLTVVGGLLGAAGVGLLGFELAALRRRRRRRALGSPSPLESALAYVRDAAGRRDPADRRRALELLARALDGEGDSATARTAERAAWGELPPSSESALELARRVEASTEDVEPA